MPRTESAIFRPLRISAAWRKILDPTVGAGADIDLVNLRTGHLFRRLDAVRLVTVGHLGLESRDIEIEHLVVIGVRVGNPLLVISQGCLLCWEFVLA